MENIQYISAIIYKMSEEQKRYDMEILKKNKEMLLTIATAVEYELDRHDLIQDPIIRNFLIIDKFLTMINFMIAGINANIANNPEMADTELTAKIHKNTSRIKRIIGELQAYALSPTYAPDHPFGNKVMKQAEEKFNDTFNTNDK